MRVSIQSIIGLIILGLIVYSNTFFNSFHFDDYQNIVNNALITDIHNLRNIWHCGPPTRFISYLSIALNYQWSGLNVVGYHVFSLLVHLASTVMVWWLVTLTLNTPLIRKETISAHSQWISFFVAAIFLAHPIQTQPVNYIIQRAVLLASFFYLCSLGLYVKARLMRKESPASQVWIMYYTGSLFAGVLSMFSKEMAVSLPLMVCFYEFFLFRGKEDYRWKMVAPFFMDVLIVLLPWMKTNANGYASGVTAGPYFLTQLKVMVTYLRLLFIPVNQSVDYFYPLARSVFEIPVILSALFLFLVLLAGGWCKNNFRVVSIGIFWFFITLLPESSIIPIQDVIFEHRLYLATMGFGLFFVGGVFYFFKNRGLLAVRVLFLFVIGYSVMTYQRNKVWENDFTLWDDAVHQSPGNSRAYLNRGAAYQNKGDLDHAMEDYNMVIGLGPIDAVTLSNRGMIFRQKGDFDHALANFNLAIKINPSYAGTYVNRGFLYKLEGKLDLALADLNKAVEMMPNDAYARALRGQIYGEKGNFQEARADYQR